MKNGAAGSFRITKTKSKTPSGKANWAKLLL